MSENKMSQYLAKNPRMIGGLFTLFLLLAQAGNSMAGGCGCTLTGP